MLEVYEVPPRPNRLVTAVGWGLCILAALIGLWLISRRPLEVSID